MSTRRPPLIQYGLRDERMIHIDMLGSADKGERCRCVCPECRAPLLARMGNVNQRHFAHQGGYACEYGPETAIHLAAKQIIADRLQIPVPGLEAYCEGYDLNHQRHFERKRIFDATNRFGIDAARLEVGMDEIRPDLIVTLAGTPILVEIAVTHPVDEEKLEKLKARRIRCIEIDLADVDPQADPAELERQIYRSVRAKWLVNPKLVRVQSAIEAQLKHQIDRVNQHIREARAKQPQFDEISRQQYQRLSQKPGKPSRKQRQQIARKNEQAAQRHHQQQLAKREVVQQADNERWESVIEQNRRDDQLEQDNRAKEQWEAERRSLDLANMQQLAADLTRSVSQIQARVERQRHNLYPVLPSIVRLAEQAMDNLGFYDLPHWLSGKTPHDWVFGVPPLDWKVAFLFNVVIPRLSFETSNWRDALTASRCDLSAYGITTLLALQRSRALIKQVDRYEVLVGNPHIDRLRGLPKESSAYLEFIGELAARGIVDLQNDEYGRLQYQVVSVHQLG